MPLLERLLLRGHIDRIKPADQDISTALDGHWTAENVVLFVGAVGAVTRLIAAFRWISWLLKTGVIGSPSPFSSSI